MAGAGGYVGRRLVAGLVGDGRPVVGLGRRAAQIPDAAEKRPTDVADTAATARALAGVDTAYYLVHSMAGGHGFTGRDRALAESFAPASSGVEVVELRAAVVIGAGSISFEILRYLTERLPVMICPRWITTRVQPIAEADLLRYLVAAPHVAPGIYEIGGPQATTYRDMIATYAAVRGLRARAIVDVPVLTPWLSAWWVDLVTPVDRRVSHSLIESLTTDVVVNDPAPAATAFDIDPLDVAGAIRAALDEQAGRVSASLLRFDPGLRDGVYAMRSEAPLPAADVAGVQSDLRRCGGDLRWYGLAWAWRLRMLLGRAFGERLRLGRPPALEPGAAVDWWQVAHVSDDALVLRTSSWFCGEAWLGFRMHEAPRPRLVQVVALRPRGVVGLVYWWALWPAHVVVLRIASRHRARRARRGRG